MRAISAGLLMCRLHHGVREYFLVHPGGPFFARKNEGVWSIPKGIPEKNEDLLEAAKREFFEETGITPVPPFYSLGTAQQKGGKLVHAWCFTGEWEPETGITCNTFPLEWPPRSGKYRDVPEVDKAEWMARDKAVLMINPAQIPFLSRADLALGQPG
ncbi:MAG TPA: NUDIX domain-containing protein [Ohtaekwangia sp.]|nr:NUDIX domain-containing protein [Ohtaekwangia sp.]